MLELTPKTRADWIGLEIAYVKEPFFDLYLLHVEGGGRIFLKDAKGNINKRYLSFAGTNRQPLRFIFKYFRDVKGMGNLYISEQRDYIAKHPEEEREVWEYNPSYTYFNITDDEPIGINNILLTTNRSAALDRKKYQVSGSLLFVKTLHPYYDKDLKVQRKSFARFYIHQDTGGAIRGAARADLYADYGQKGEVWANYMNETGEMYLLAIKK